VQNCTFSFKFSTQTEDANIECESYKWKSSHTSASYQRTLEKWHSTNSVATTHL